MTTITLTTASGTNASAIGDAYAGYGGVHKWRDSIDNCDDTGAGRVFLDCDDDAVDFLVEQIEIDDRIVSYAVYKC